MNMYEQLQQKSQELGLCFLYATSAAIEFPEKPIRYTQSQGYYATMDWLSNNIHTRLRPGKICNFAQSIIVCGLPYYQPLPDRRGAIAMYALGRDYHKVLKKKLAVLAEYIQSFGHETRCFVDSAPIPERPIAVKAGVGWIGKSSLVVSKEQGTLFFLGEIFTSLVVPYGTEQKNQCGTCTACIQACPTHAIMPDGYVDARKCISYLTIEHDGVIPVAYRKAIGNRLYGCDECSKSCIYNSFSNITSEPDFTPRVYPDLHEILAVSAPEFARIFAGSPIHRIGLQRLQRNACVVLGNIGTQKDIVCLQTFAKTKDPILQEHANWAIQSIMKK